jgi:DNA-directed RNA polymerase subunit RPC12/RpoP
MNDEQREQAEHGVPDTHAAPATTTTGNAPAELRPVPEALAPKSVAVGEDEMYKRCPHCGKRLKMLVVETPSPELKRNKIMQVLIRLFSPGGVEINRRYRCPRCSNEFNDMTVNEAVLAPALMVAFLIVSLLAFLWFVLTVVAGS